MAEQSRYSDEQVDAAIAEFCSGGDPLPPEILAHLSPTQLRRFAKTLERMEADVLREWRRAWWNGEIAEVPPGGIWWYGDDAVIPPGASPICAPDDLRSLDGPDVA